MEYLIFAVLLVLTNVLTFYYSVRVGIRITAKTLDDLSNEREQQRKLKNYHFKTDYSNNKVMDYALPDYVESKRILDLLQEAADKYGMVSVADYYNLIEVDSSLKDYGYGWSALSISKASISPVRGGFIINFPPFESIVPDIKMGVGGKGK